MNVLTTSSKMAKAVKVDADKRVIPKKSATKPRWWRVTLGKKVTGTGKIRRFFATEKAAHEFIAAATAAARQRGQLAFGIPQKLAVEAMELTRELEPHGVTLTQAVKFYLDHGAQQTARLFSDLVPEYRRAQEISLLLFEKEFGKKPVAGIAADSIEKWLDGKGWRPLNRRNYIRDLAMFFNWAKLHGHVAGNPCDRVMRPKVPGLIPAIYTVDEVRRLLNTAREHSELGLLNMYALALFAGVRVREILRYVCRSWCLPRFGIGDGKRKYARRADQARPGPPPAHPPPRAALCRGLSEHLEADSSASCSVEHMRWKWSIFLELRVQSPPILNLRWHSGGTWPPAVSHCPHNERERRHLFSFRAQNRSRRHENKNYLLHGDLWSATQHDTGSRPVPANQSGAEAN